MSARQTRVVIPVKVDGAKLTFAFGQHLPDLVDGARAEVVIDAESIADKYLLKLLQAEQIVDLLDVDAQVLIEMRPCVLPAELLRKLYVPSRRLQAAGGRYVEVTLTSPLRLRLSGARRGAFTGGSCVIPALGDRPAISLNQAFTFISEVYEPDRQSHVGNAFLRGLFFNEQSDAWSRLEDLRKAYERRFQDYLTQQFAINTKRKRLSDPPSFEEWLEGKRRQTTMEF